VQQEPVAPLPPPPPSLPVQQAPVVTPRPEPEPMPKAQPPVQTEPKPQPVPQPAVQSAPKPVSRPAPLPSEPAPATKATPVGSVQQSSKLLAATVVSTFTDRLKAEARKNGGYLSEAHIDQLSQEFESKQRELEKVFELTFDQMTTAQNRAKFDHAREYPFDRIIVNTFAELFDQERVDDDGSAAVTRRILPGFFIAIDKMLGPEAIENFQRRSRAVLTRLGSGKESEVDWQVVYDDPVADEICKDALVTFLPYFADIQKRMDWFVPLVNGSVVPSDEDPWELTEAGFYNFSAEMFSQLRTALEDKAERAKLEKRHGGVAIFHLDQAFEQIDKALEGEGGGEDD